MNQCVADLSYSSSSLEGKYKLTTTVKNAEYLVAEKRKSPMRTPFEIFYLYGDAKKYIDSRRKEAQSRTYVLFEKMN